MKIFKKYRIDKLPKIDESIARSNTILIHWENVPYNSTITYISGNINLLGYSVLDCIKDYTILFNIRNIGDKIQLQKNIQNLKNKKYNEFEYQFRGETSSGEEIWLRENSRIIYKDGVLAYGETFLSDITKEKNLEKYNIEYNIEEEKQRNEIFAYIIQLLDSDQDFETIVFTLLEVIGKYQKLNNTVIFKIGIDHNFEVVGEWKSEGATSFENFSGDRMILNEAALNTNIVAISESEDAGIYCSLMKHSNAVSMLSIPIIINEKPAMLATFFDNKLGRKWDVATISFFTDICRMLESIINRRITKNSLISSYAALKEILDNIGSIIYVFDKQSKQILFCNELFKKTCKQDMVGKYCWDFYHGKNVNECDECSLIRYSNRFIEDYNPQTERWSEIRYHDITWVDGRSVSLCIITDVTDMKKYQKKIEFQANNDFLTGLYNRMRCEQDLSVLIQEALDSQKLGAVLFIDLDDFKHINDGLGHQYGDLLLKMIAIGLQQIRGLADKCYRVGGDEFLIIVPPEEFKNIDYILESIKKLFSKPWYLEEGEYYCTMSMGIVCFPKDGEDVGTLIKKADIAMYDAKNSGKNRYKFYNSGEEKYSYERLDIEKNMRLAVSAYFKGFELYIQPVIDTMTQECIGGEALLRWNCEQLGLLMPNEFIPIAEHIGLIIQIGDFVFRQACLINKRWSDEGIDMRISVNLSVVQLLQNDIVESIEDILKETQVKPQNLVLEVTENLAINDMSRMKKIIDNIKLLGVGIALDDFGTGYSSLSYIKQMSLDIIKVDKSFVDDIVEDNYARAFVKLIAELSEQLNVEVCVEGVETQEQYDILKKMNVSHIQGYYFGKPSTVKEFEKKYFSWE